MCGCVSIGVESSSKPSSAWVVEVAARNKGELVDCIVITNLKLASTSKAEDKLLEEFKRIILVV